MPNDVMTRAGLLVSQDAPPYMEATRTGNSWSTMTVTAFTPQAAFPTTQADLEIWNNTNSGITLAISTLSVWEKVGTAIPRATCLFAQVAAVKGVPTLTALTVGSLSGRGIYTSAVGTRIVTGVTTTVIANAWQPFGNPQLMNTAAATPGASWHAEVNGRLLVPPGCSLCVAGVSSAATGTLQIGASWFEIPALTNVL